MIEPTLTKHARLLPQREVAHMIGLSEARLERMRWQGGGIPYRKLGRTPKPSNGVGCSHIPEEQPLPSCDVLGTGCQILPTV